MSIAVLSMPIYYIHISVVRYIGILLISGILNHTILYFFHPQPGIVIGVILLPALFYYRVVHGINKRAFIAKIKSSRAKIRSSRASSV